MNRLTTNKDTSEMSMYELAHNACYSKDGLARYRDFEMDMDARDFARNLMTTLTSDELPVDDDAFDDEIMENLMHDPFESVNGLIALFYRNLCAMADLRETLKVYEDAAERENRWIMCSERMPTVETEVFILAKRKFKDGDYKYIRTTAMYEDGKVSENDSCWFWQDIEGEWDEENDCYIIPQGWWESRHYNPDDIYNNVVDDEVVAWQPMPPEYKESGERPKKTNFDRCCENVEAMAQIIDIAKIGWTKDQIMEWLQKEECEIPEPRSGDLEVDYKTNADRIRSMSDEELAEFIEQISADSMDTISFGTKDYEEIWEHKETALKWLQSEVEE